MTEVKVNLGPKANNDNLVVVDHGLKSECFFVEYTIDGETMPRERILAREAQDLLQRKNRAALRKYFPMANF